MSPFLAAFLGGLVGGVVCGLVLGAVLAVFGPPIAERLLHKQVTFLEARLKENILEVALGRVGAFLDQSERIGQVVKRVAEIAQLLLKRGPPEAPAPAPAASGAGAVAQEVLRDLVAAALAVKPASAAPGPVPPIGPGQA